MITTRRLDSLSLVLILLSLTACTTPAEVNTDNGTTIDASCVPSAPPANLELDPFYEKHCSIAGIPIVASTAVPDTALVTTAEVVAQMLEPLSTAEIDGLKSIELKVGVIGAQQVTTDMPEYSDLNDEFPDFDWDADSRGLGATKDRPLTSSGEENLLCYADDPYKGESILVHEFAHTIKQYGVAAADSGFAAKVKEAYDAAMAVPLWEDTYAATDPEEYWAEGVQSYFGVNLSADSPNGIHNHVDTRAELATYDPALFNLVHEVFDGLTVDDPCS